ncbi:arginine N-succinyltransferase [Aestuariibacter salexigens]|uniref:arginine N-succinyltransferase n=1 Tax=Aestuariibacter salexigens TaxID=226010 RepID=UPI0004167E2F|nr:arginine N-succinyltransferase [Aestuariibacter salexigens]
MICLRPIRQADLPELEQIAKLSGPGFTSLPDDISALNAKIKHSIESFKRHVTDPKDECYLFALEDQHTGQLIGTTGIIAKTGLGSPMYHLRQVKHALTCHDMALRNEFESLILTTDCSGATEVCSLFLHPDYRVGKNGRFLSRSRFLFMAEQSQRFNSRVIAEMRGVSCAQGTSPFWDWMRERFTDIPFSELTHRVGLGETAFIPHIMPRHPLPLSCLSDDARAVVGTVHPDTEPAKKLLQKEGFCFRGCVDVFDAGPTLEAELSNIHTVVESRRTKVHIEHVKPGETLMVANCSHADFRATFTEQAIFDKAQNTLLLSPVAADLLRVMNGDDVRICTL